MPLPTLQKTWQISPNNTVAPVAGATNGIYVNRLMTWKMIKDKMVGFGSNPWTVVGSSNAHFTNLSANAGTAAMDGVDRWNSSSDFIDANNLGFESASRFPWIVLQQSQLGGGTFQVCYSSGGTGNSATGTVVVSPSAGFTGGAVNARPTATDEIILINNAFTHSGIDTTHQVHAWESTDGYCTRISVHRGGTNQCLFLLFDRAQNPVTNWTNPVVAAALSTNISISASYASLNNSTSAGIGLIRGRGSSTMAIQLTGETDASIGAVLANITDIGTVVNDFDGSWPFFPMGISCKTVGHKGRHGSLFDIWWRPSAVNEADTFPNSSSNRQFVALGNIILPWTNDSTVPLLT